MNSEKLYNQHIQTSPIYWEDLDKVFCNDVLFVSEMSLEIQFCLTVYSSVKSGFCNFLIPDEWHPVESCKFHLCHHVGHQLNPPLNGVANVSG